MSLKKYTIAEFRMATREAFNEVEQGGRVFITRHGTRFELIKADVQGGKAQLAEPRRIAAVSDEPVPTNTFVHVSGPTKDNKVTVNPFPDNGDATAQLNTAHDIADVFGPAPEGARIAGIDYPLPEKNIADADASVKGLEPPTAEYILSWNWPMIASWSTLILRDVLAVLQKSLDAIDIDTQDPDEVERGAELAARIEDTKIELKKRGA